MNRLFTWAVFVVGLLVIGWVAWGFVGGSALALTMTLAIAASYLLGAQELRQFRAATATLEAALADLTHPPARLDAWLARVSPALQNPVRLRIEGTRTALPNPTLTPYLVGLLVMLGMLGTFLGMVVTFKGAVFALEGSTDLQAIRSALAEPIRGLGLSFGTSVAGVAGSAMLGLLSAISRRERLQVVRQLDDRIATVLRPFSLAHQREETLKALQAQTDALPQVMDRMAAMLEQMERHSAQTHAQLAERQAQFHQATEKTYTVLADSVGRSLQSSLEAGARAMVQNTQPVIEAAMAAMARESAHQHTRVGETVQTQLGNLLAGFDQHAQTLLAGVRTALAASHTDQAQADAQRLQAWSKELETLGANLQREWAAAGTRAQAQHQALCETLERTASAISDRTAEQAQRTLDGIGNLLERSEALVSARVATESAWVSEHGSRMDTMATVWRQELAALRNDEAVRGQAAVDRLTALQVALSTQLATLGAALEQPMSRLMETAAQAPQAAAELMIQLREEMARLTARDTTQLEERSAVMERLQALMDAADQTARRQHDTLETLVASTTAVLDQASAQFAQALATQTGQAADLGAHLQGSAIELSTLGETFHHAVTLFNTSNGHLLEALQRVEAAVSQSMARSDEQLAYYVGQAREVIDLSLTSQKAMVEDLRRLQGQLAPGAGA